MDVVALTRALVDIESITENEERVGEYLFAHLRSLAEAHAGRVEKIDVAPRRFNVLSRIGATPVVTLSTHMDTVPPFFPSREDDERHLGPRGLRYQGHYRVHDQGRRGLLAAGVAISACCSWWARNETAPAHIAAANDPRGSRNI